MTQTPTPNGNGRLNQIEQVIVQLADGQNALFDAVTRIVNSQIRLEEVVGTTRTELNQSVAGINQTLANFSQRQQRLEEIVASLAASEERQNRILDYLLQQGEQR